MKNGYILIEVFIAVILLSVIILPMFSSLSYLQIKTKEGEFDSEAAGILQDGMEIARTNVLSNWTGYPDGEYHPSYDVSDSTWKLVSGSESGLNAKYDRSIRLTKVCRDPDNGERLESTNCGINADPTTRLVTASVKWKEREIEKSLDASLLVFKKDD